MKINFSDEIYISEEFQEKLKEEILSIKNNSAKARIKVAFNVTGVDLLFYKFFKINDIDIVHRMPSEIVTPKPVDVCVYFSRKEDPDWLVKLSINQIPNPSHCLIATIFTSSNDEIVTLFNADYEKTLKR